MDQASTLSIDELILDELGSGAFKQVKPAPASQKITKDNASRAKKFITPTTSQMLRTALRKPQAITKITSYGHGKGRVKAHIRYISRHGQLNLEDENGNLYSELKEQYQVIDHWAIDFGNSEKSRDTLHLVLSTPPGSDRQAALKTAKEFLADEFKKRGHEYLFVAHNDTDHPHVHAVIKMVSKRGKKLNPKKAFLYHMRQKFSECCRTNGIDVEASSRAERGLSGKSENSKMHQMKKKRKQQPKADQKIYNKAKQSAPTTNTTSDSIQEKMLRRNQIIRKRYADKAKELYQKSKSQVDMNAQEKYQKAAKILDEYAKIMPVENTRQDRMTQKIDKKTRKESLCNSSDTFNQYCATAKDYKNDLDVYISPMEIVANRLSDVITKEVLQKKQKGQSSEYDIAD